MQTSFKRLASGSAALVMSSVLAVLSFTPAMNAGNMSASAAAVDFEANAGAYDTWDGVSYDFSWYGDGTETSYEIGSAAQLASLSILTNDLSSVEWEIITQNISPDDQQYIPLVDSFKDKTITLTSDIDLGNFDWMPISYPWRTPNLSSSYEFVNTEGETVTYNAVDHIPELETVDPWVGDKNGDPISTRYWEFPESEMRFRDLVMPINFESMNELVDGNISLDRSLFVSVQGIGTFNQAGALTDSIFYMYPYGISDTPEYVYSYVKPRDYDWDIIKSYTYKNINDFTEIAPFSGTIDGASHRIKGLAPSTPWTSDVEQRLHTYDPLAKGFISQLGEEGSLKNLDVQGSYDNEVMSYSAILCAYNYGLIDNCSVDSKTISQALITMIYPTRREYSPNHDSVYEYTETPGTVIPVGNSGVISSQNYGTISNCVASGSVSQAFRQFGCVSCTNYGTISDCINLATVDSYTVQTDFTTDEWSYNTEYIGVVLNPNFNDYHYFTLMLSDVAEKRYTDKFGLLDEVKSSYITPMDTMLFRWTSGSKTSYDSFRDMVQMDIALDETMLLTCSNLYKGEIDRAVSEGGVSWGIITHDLQDPRVNQLAVGGSSPLITEGQVEWLSKGEKHTGSMQEELLWLPGLYKTSDGESIAANHLYGNYELATLGGICAVNEGVVTDCSNQGILTALHNITEQSAHGRYRHSEEEINKQDYYSYIRPTNQYGIFSTVVNTVSYAGGICAFNSGEVQGCGNTALIKTPSEYYDECWETDLEVIKKSDDYDLFDFIDYIPATLNNYYQNGVLLSDRVADVDSCSLYANAWWVTEEWLEENAVDGHLQGIYLLSDVFADPVSYDLDIETYFDRNMPYPFTFRYAVSQIGISSGIACTNVGTVHNIRTSGEAQDSVISVSDGMDSAIDVYNVETKSTSRAFRNLVNTALNDITVDGADSFAVNILQRGDAQVDSSYIYIIDTTDTKPEIVLIQGDDADKFTFSQVSFKKTDEQKGAALAANITRATINELINQSSYGSPGYMTSVKLTDYYVADSNGIVTMLEGEDCTITNVYANVAYATNLCGLKDSSVLNMQVFSKGVVPVGYFVGCELEGIRIFGDDTTIYCSDCRIDDFISVGEVHSNARAKCDKWGFDNITDYVYFFVNTSARDMYLESEIDYTLVGLNQPGFSYSTVPGVVAIINTTDVFDHCSINAPDGVLSYSYPNHLILDEVPTGKEYGIVYSDHAARDGAMAYALTTEDRKFTVTSTDVVKQVDSWQEFGLSELLNRCSYAIEEWHLPVYTRECIDDSEPIYHKLSIPYVSYGIGELVASREENSETYTTHATGEIFPHTDIFAKSGETVRLRIEAEDGYALSGVSEYIGKAERKIATDGAYDKPYTISSYTMGDSDVVLMGDWAGVFDIEVDSSVMDILDIVPNAKAAIKGQQISVNSVLRDDSWTVQNFYYIPYKVDGSNRRVLDPDNMVVIDDTAKFIMPDTPIKIFVNLLNNVACIQRFIVSGQEATISGNNVDLYFDNSIDVASLEVESYVLSNGATISPDPLTVTDFTQPVIFTVASESGYYENQFVVTVHTIADGKIKLFQINGFNGVINDDNSIIVNIPMDLDVSNVRPYVIWSGKYIRPDLAHSFNFDEPVTFEVGALDGTVTTYTVSVNRTDLDTEPLQVFEIDGTLTEIDHINRRIKISYPYGMDVSDILIGRLEYVGASCSIPLGSYMNLTQSNKLSVVDTAGNVVTYTIVASEADPSMAGILQFNIFGRNAVIDNTNHTITVDLPEYIDKTNIAPYLITFLGKELAPSSVIKQDFSNPVQYTVSAYTGESVTYTVIVN